MQDKIDNMHVLFEEWIKDYKRLVASHPSASEESKGYLRALEHMKVLIDAMLPHSHP